MSDPVTNAEVEDVLSSIRRLVSEDNRPVQVSKADSKSGALRQADLAHPEPKSDRLVLTPALRVTEASSDGASAVSGTDSGADIDALITDDTPLDVFGLRAVPTAVPDHDDSDQGVFDDLDKDDSLVDPAHDYSTDPYNFDDDADDDGEGQGHLVPAMNGEHREDEARSEVSETAAFNQSLEAALSEPEPEATTSETASQNSVGETAVPATPIERAPDETISSEKSIALTAKIAALETAIGQISETWEPDTAGDSDYAGSEAGTMAWEDDIPDHPILSKTSNTSDAQSKGAETEPSETLEVMEAQLEEFFSKSEKAKETVPSPSDVPTSDPSVAQAEDVEDTPAVPDQPGFDYSGEEQLIDEEALRDLVSEIVRAELQGALGERITRNVRKLVRREIHRALAAQELE